MENERYQLVAIDNDTKEKYVIKLNNGNKFNKGTLGFIDRGTSSFTNEFLLAGYLYNKGKIPTLNVKFIIVYLQNKNEKTLSVIFNDRSIYNVSKMIGNKVVDDNYFSYYLVRLLLAKLCSKEFYAYLLKENSINRKLKSSGDYLNDKIMKIIISYYDNYVSKKNIDANTADIQYGLLKELSQYKQLRTLYYIIKKYDSQRKINHENDQELTLDDLCCVKPISIPPIKPEKQEEVEQLIRVGGMDEVYSHYDLDDICDVGCLNYKKVGNRKKGAN